MTAGLETFAKVRALHDSTANPGEKASAAARMKTLARKAGLTVEEAVSKLDAPPVTIVASCTVDAAEAFNAFFNTPQMRVERAEREARRRVEAAAVIERHGSEEVLFADTPLEAALRAACEHLLGRGETWRTIYRLDGWGALSPDRDMPATVRAAVSEAWPLPATVAQAWAEYEASEVRIRDCYTVDVHCDPEVYVRARQHVLAGLLNTLPARSMNDARARLSWLEFWPGIEVEQDSASLRATLATLRADVERMGQRLRGQDAGAATNPLEQSQCDATSGAGSSFRDRKQSRYLCSRYHQDKAAMTSDYACGSPGVLCVLYLEQAAHEAEQAIEDPQRWFFAIPQMYQALGAILVAALAGSASFGAYTEKVQREWTAYFDRPDYPDHPPPEGDFMQPISALLRRVQDGSEPEMQGRPVVLTAGQKKDLVRLTYFRGQMEHVRPGSWGLEAAGLPRILAAAAEVIRQLLEHRRCCTDLEEDDEARAAEAIERINAVAAAGRDREAQESGRPTGCPALVRR